MTTINRELLSQLPKVVLHDHLDGGLRPSTIIELADEVGYKLPVDTPDALAAWIQRGADRLDLNLYLETFEYTIAVSQTEAALERIAYEAGVDLANDGVVYAEVRYAPELCINEGLRLEQVVEATLAGFRRAQAEHPIVLRTIICAMRSAAVSVEIAELAVKYRDQGVVGFDIAGPEVGFRPTRHLAAFQHVMRENFHITIHAGEAFGLPSIWEALQFCGAERLGHGVRIVDDITFDGDGQPVLGDLANFVRDRRVPLELCPTSNVHTGAAASVAEHPIKMLRDLKFRVTINTDNRLMSDISMTDEFMNLHEAFGWDLEDFKWLTVNGMKSAFLDFDARLNLIDAVIKPGYKKLQRES